MSIKETREVVMLRKRLVLVVAIATALLSFSCSEVNKDTSPVLLDGSATQTVQVVDLNDPACPANLGTINLRAIVKNPATTDTHLLDVQLQKMAVSYQRTDGGKAIPQPFVQTITGEVTVGASATPLNDFVLFQVNALEQAPFVALVPGNGGVDPETGQSFVKMDVVVDIFGETLSGSKVSTEVKIPLTFCFNCGGCR